MIDIARTVLHEEIVLNKFEGDPKDGVIVETITFLDGVIVKRETFNNEGGNTHATN